MSKNPLPVMLFGHTRYKKSKKTLPLSRNRHVKLSWNHKNPHRQRVLDLSPPPLDDACSTYIHACSTYIHAQHTYIHAQHTYIHAQHTCIHTYLLNSCAAYICMYLCMYVCYMFDIGGFWSHKIQISCLDQKVCPNLSFCKCFEAFWRAWSKLNFLSFWRPV